MIQRECILWHSKKKPMVCENFLGLLFWEKQSLLELKPLLIWAWVYSASSHLPHLLQPEAVGFPVHACPCAEHPPASPSTAALPAPCPAQLPTIQEGNRAGHCRCFQCSPLGCAQGCAALPHHPLHPCPRAHHSWDLWTAWTARQSKAGPQTHVASCTRKQTILNTKICVWSLLLGLI